MHTPTLIATYRFLFLLIVLIAYFIVRSLGEGGILQHITNGVLVLLIIYSLYVIGQRKRFLIVGLAILGAAEILSLFLLNAVEFTYTLRVLQISLALIFFLLMTIATLDYTFHSKRISTLTLFGAVCAYLFIGLAWSYAYLLLDFLNAHAFNLADMTIRVKEQQFIYYSFVTLTTLGYGDIVPLSNLARVLSWMEAVIGQAYVTILIAQLVARYVVTYER